MTKMSSQFCIKLISLEETSKSGKLAEWNRFLSQKYSLPRQLPGFFLDNYDEPADDAEMRAELQRLNTHVSAMSRFRCQDAQVGCVLKKVCRSLLHSLTLMFI